MNYEIKNEIQKNEIWNMKHETWNMKYEIWNMKYEIWNMKYKRYNGKLKKMFLQRIKINHSWMISDEKNIWV